MRSSLNKIVNGETNLEKRNKLENELDSFFELFRRYLIERSNGMTLDWDKISSPSSDEVIQYEKLNCTVNKLYLSKLAVLKLNGGLGTSMGCVGPKSVIEVREGNNFLDLVVRQIEHLNLKYDSDVPLLLMNSFNTDGDTDKIIQKYQGHRTKIRTFNQLTFPRIYKDSLLPVPQSCKDTLDSWYPPGHGDFFESLVKSGELDRLIAEGRTVMFVSNGDNLGATIDFKILSFMIEDKSEFIMELTNKTRADVKGGTLIKYDSQLRLLEIAQVPKQHIEDFVSIKKFKYFNTNNLWIDLKAIKRVVNQNLITSEIIPNNKIIKKDGSEINVLQLETAIGSAIKHFNRSHGIVVPRSRFLPVKTCSDLLLVKSDLFYLDHGKLKLDPSREDIPNPLIKLGSHYKKVVDFQSRIPHMPKILELDHLTVEGNVKFGRNVTLKGTVVIVSYNGNEIDIPNGSVLENVVVTGNLNIFEH